MNGEDNLGAVSTKLDYDDQTVVTMLAALRNCPSAQRLDSLVAVCKVVIEADLLKAWPGEVDSDGVEVGS